MNGPDKDMFYLCPSWPLLLCGMPRGKGRWAATPFLWIHVDHVARIALAETVARARLDKRDTDMQTVRTEELLIRPSEQGREGVGSLQVLRH